MELSNTAICPYCGKEMQKGILSGDGRSKVTWKPGNTKAGFMDKLVGSYTVTATSMTLTTFTIDAYYCPACRKMIFDTDITG